MSANFFQQFVNTVLLDTTGNPIPKNSFQIFQSQLSKTLASIVPLTGLATLSGGTITVTPTAPDGTLIPCKTSSKIWVTAQDDNSTGALRADPGSGSFVIKSSNSGDSGVVAWMIVP